MSILLVTAILAIAQTPAEPTLADALTRLQDKDAAVRLKAVTSLGAWKTDLPPKALVALAKAMDDPDAKVRKLVVQTLGETGPRAREWAGGPAFAAQLARAFQDKDALTKRTAVWAYGQIGVDTKEELQPLFETLKNASPDMRGQAAASLTQYVHEQTTPEWRREILDAVVELLGDRDVRVQRLTGQLLVACGEDAVPQLIRYLDKSKNMPRLWAAACLGEIGPPAKEALPSLIKAFGEASKEGRPTIQVAIKKIGG